MNCTISLLGPEKGIQFKMTTALFLLRCVEIGISISELDLLTIGMALDMWTEKTNAGVKYSKVACKQSLINSSACSNKSSKYAFILKVLIGIFA